MEKKKKKKKRHADNNHYTLGKYKLKPQNIARHDVMYLQSQLFRRQTGGSFVPGQPGQS
jgi:hypothetical protein